MTEKEVGKAVAILRRQVPTWDAPVVTQMAGLSRDPFQILISCLLSLRTKDQTTGPAARRLFALADTPEKMTRLSPKKIAKVIYPVGFYRTKARTILHLCRELLDKYDGTVPDEIDELLTLKGIGRKTANLVVTLGYRKPGICVDTHVHRISNRWGLVRTKTPLETEMALRHTLPRRYWIEFNDLLVALGQQICHPLSPRCSLCPVERYCAKIGVQRNR